MFHTLSLLNKGLIAGLFAYSCFSIADACAKWLTAHYSIYQVMVMEAGIALLGLVAFVAATKTTKELFCKKDIKINILRAILNFGITVAIIYALSRLPLGAFYTIVFSKPILISLMAIALFAEWPDRGRWIAIFIGFAGVLVAFRPWEGSIDPMLALVFVTTFFIALLFILPRKLENGHPAPLAFYPIAGTVILALPLMIINYSTIELTHLPIIVLGGATMLGGIGSISYAFRIAPAAAVSPLMYSQMIWALVIGYFIFDDTPEPWILAGAGIIITSGLYLVTHERKKK